MNLKEITKPITAESLNETLAKRFGKKLNVQKFTNEQLEDARNKLRTQLSAIETNESFDDVHSNDTYQKSKLMLDVLNAEISQRDNIVGEEKKPDKDGDGVPDWADKKPGEDDHAKKDSKSDKGLSAKQKKLPKGLQNAIAKKKTNEGKYEYFDDKATAQAHAEKHGGKVYTNSGKGNAGGKNTHVVIKDIKLKEGKEDEAELVMASKDMVDRVTSWMEDTAEMQTESMLELADAIRDEMGMQQSDAFVGTVKPALEAMYDVMETTRAALTQGVGMLTGEGEAPAPDMGAELPAEPEGDVDADMEPTVDADDEFAAAEAGAGGEEEAGRAKRESIEMSRRIGQILAGSKKKS